MSDVTISIVSYCQKTLLKKCLKNIEQLGLPPSWKTIVIDNNSVDGSADMVAENYPWIKLIRLQKNIGFAGGHNIAYVETNSPIFIVLNPDVVVLPGSLETLIQMFEKFPKAAIIGPCLLNQDGSLQFSARRFYNWYTVACRRLPLPGRKKINDYHLMKDCQLDQMLRVDWILGAAMSIRRTSFNGENLFDTHYKLYFEDVDLCYTAQKNGWDVLYCPQSKMIHHHQRVSATHLFNSATVNHLTSWIKFYLKSKKLKQTQTNQIGKMILSSSISIDRAFPKNQNEKTPHK